MGDDKDKGSLGPISGVLFILAAFGATFFVQPFKGDRPYVPEIRESYEKINARLWQDPFRAILDASKGSEARTEAAYEFDLKDGSGKPGVAGETVPGKKVGRQSKSQPNSAPKGKEPAKIEVLGVMVPGAPYDADTEMRMRLRYAVLLGLCRIGFAPADSEHIEYIRIRPGPKKDRTGKHDKAGAEKGGSGKNTLANIIPFEWMKDRQGRSILVLWINDNIFRPDPLQYLSNLGSRLKNRYPKEEISDFKIIGPAASDTLARMVNKTSSLFRGYKSVSIYSAMATADDKFLFGEKIENTDKMEMILREKIGSGKKFTFERIVGEDARLAKMMVDELKLRKIEFQDENTHIVLVTEFDTLYGHSISESFQAAFGKDIRKDKPEYIYKDIPEYMTEYIPEDIPAGMLEDALRRQLHFISYLRGIDGSLPGEKEEKKGDEKSDTKSTDPFRDIKKLEQPVGKSQYDYLRRLADEIYRLDQDLLYMNGKSSVKAIGILGTDYYDKYLVLQALRQRLPDAVYFTTDLDARMLHPDHIQWTRNLLVASNFGLSLRKDDKADIQGGVPPFRDNYQTSVFLSVLRAFREYSSLSRDEADVGKLIAQPMGNIQPLLFEIGRYRPVDLTMKAAGETVHPTKRFTTYPSDWYKNPFWRITGFTILMFFLAMIVLYFTSPIVNTGLKSITGTGMVAIGTWVLFAVTGAHLIYWISHQPGQEPFSLFEGISAWPTLLFRIGAIVLSCLFFYWSQRDLEKNRQATEDELLRKDTGPATASGGHPPVKTPAFSGIDWPLSEVAPDSTLNGLWENYLHRDADEGRYRRVGIIVISYLGLCGLVILLFGPPVTPMRGDFSFVMNFMILFITVILFAVLAFYVLDVTRSCRKFIGIASTWLTLPGTGATATPQRVGIKEEWTLIRLIAMRTEAVGKLIFYPLIVWLVMFISRFQYFDNWTTPRGLMVVICLGAMLPWICAFLLRRSAEHARSRVMGHLEGCLLDLRAGGRTEKNATEYEDTIRYIEVLMEKVRNIRQGAFAPYSQHPVVQSLLIPFGGVGGAYLIDFFTKTNF